MSTLRPRTDSRLLRIEVHGVSIDEDGDTTLSWEVRARRIEDDLVYFGFLMRRDREGFGQAQAISIGVGVAADDHDAWDDDAVREWGELYAFEPMWDLLRRALQSQAGAMDFQFDIPLKAPEAALEVQTPLD